MHASTEARALDLVLPGLEGYPLGYDARKTESSGSKSKINGS